MVMRMVDLRLVVVCQVALLCSACGSGRPALQRVSGTVTLDGQPLEGAGVSLAPMTGTNGKLPYGRPSFGVTDSQGKFRLGTYGDADGVPAGKYRVLIKKWEIVGEPPKESAQQSSMHTRYRWITPKDASNPATSEMEVEVTSQGMQPNQFDLKSSPATEIEEIIGGAS